MFAVRILTVSSVADVPGIESSLEQPPNTRPARIITGQERLATTIDGFCRMRIHPDKREVQLPGYSNRSSVTKKNNPTLTTALTRKNAMFTRVRSSGRTSRCSYTNSTATPSSPTW